jgi:AraC-like DNA-binding protein
MVQYEADSFACNGRLIQLAAYRHAVVRRGVCRCPNSPRNGCTVLSGHEFKRIRRRRRNQAPTGRPNDATLHALLSEWVIDRFARLGSAELVAVPLRVPRCEGDEDAPANPGHPACLEYAGTDYCRESWLLHLAQLKAEPATHWHQCDYDRLCALVPVVYQGRCLAAIKLACPSVTRKEEFERQVELLDILVRDFVFRSADFLARLSGAVPACPDLSAASAEAVARPATPQPGHPQILRALRYVEERLSDPALTVGSVARQMGVHPNYLSRLFVHQVGQRLSRFIAVRRIERAKTLLATTHWQIKRIARETGHANPNWFSYVFRALTGVAPSAYREETRGR